MAASRACYCASCKRHELIRFVQQIVDTNAKLDMSGGSFQSPSGPPSTSLIVPLQSPPGRKYIIVPASLLQRQQSPSCINGTAAVSATGHPNLEMVSEIASVPNNISPVQVRTVTTVPHRNIFSANIIHRPYPLRPTGALNSRTIHRSSAPDPQKPTPVPDAHPFGDTATTILPLPFAKSPSDVVTNLESHVANRNPCQLSTFHIPCESATELDFPAGQTAKSSIHPDVFLRADEIVPTEPPRVHGIGNPISFDCATHLTEMPPFSPELLDASCSFVERFPDVIEAANLVECRKEMTHEPQVFRQIPIGVDPENVEKMAPVMDIPFPVMHTFNLHTSSVIPNTTTTEESRDPSERLRPSARLLMMLGKSLVREQYHKQVMQRRLRGIRPPPSAQDEAKRRAAIEVFREALPPANLQAATLLRATPSAATIGNAAESTAKTCFTRACAAAGCPYQFYSHLAMIRHLSEGHHNLHRVFLRQQQLGNAHPIATMYPVNPLRQRNATTYACPKCNSLFTSMKAIESHVSKNHTIPHFLANQTATTKACCACRAQIDRSAANLPVCQIKLRGGHPRQLRQNIRSLLGTDSARAIFTHSLALFQLLPSPETPLVLPELTAAALLVSASGALQDPRMADKYARAISTLYGQLMFRYPRPYKRVVEPPFDLTPLYPNRVLQTSRASLKRTLPPPLPPPPGSVNQLDFALCPPFLLSSSSSSSSSASSFSPFPPGCLYIPPQPPPPALAQPMPTGGRSRTRPKVPSFRPGQNLVFNQRDSHTSGLVPIGFPPTSTTARYQSPFPKRRRLVLHDPLASDSDQRMATEGGCRVATSDAFMRTQQHSGLPINNSGNHIFRPRFQLSNEEHCRRPPLPPSFPPHIFMRPPPPPPSLHSDSQQLRSAMWNLRPRLPVVHQQPPALHDLLQRPSQSLVLNSVMPPPPPPTSVEPTAPPHLLKCSQQRMPRAAGCAVQPRMVIRLQPPPANHRKQTLSTSQSTSPVGLRQISPTLPRQLKPVSHGPATNTLTAAAVAGAAKSLAEKSVSAASTRPEPPQKRHKSSWGGERGSITCPMCTFSSDDRSVIMEHIMGAH